MSYRSDADDEEAAGNATEGELPAIYPAEHARDAQGEAEEKAAFKEAGVAGRAGGGAVGSSLADADDYTACDAGTQDMANDRTQDDTKRGTDDTDDTDDGNPAD